MAKKPKKVYPPEKVKEWWRKAARKARGIIDATGEIGLAKDDPFLLLKCAMYLHKYE